VRNVLLIWLDSNSDKNNDDCRNMITQLRCVVNTINTFTDVDQCMDFLTANYNEEILMVISDALVQQTVPLIQDITQLHRIFLSFVQTKQDMNNWSKINSVFTEISSICEALKQTAHQCEQKTISFGSVSTNDDAFKTNLDQLDCSFMYTKILKEFTDFLPGTTCRQ
jgi:hypothetical protein